MNIYIYIVKVKILINFVEYDFFFFVVNLDEVENFRDYYDDNFVMIDFFYVNMFIVILNGDEVFLFYKDIVFLVYEEVL